MVALSESSPLADWERAEVARSRVQASMMCRVQPTAASVIRRYAAPAADSPYALEYVYHLLGDLRGRTVLDFGCGDGRDATLLASKGAVVYALDLSPDLLALAAARARADGHAGTVQFLRASAHAVPLPDESVDVVLGNAVLHHLDLARASREVFRVLRPGGRAIFKEPVRESRLVRMLRTLVPYRRADVSPFERPLRRAEVEAFSRPFRAGRARMFGLPFVAAARLLNTSRVVQAKSHALDGRILAACPRLRMYASILVFELHKPGCVADGRA